MLQLPAALAPFARYRHFVIYRLQPSQDEPGVMDKLPCDWRTGHVHNAHDTLIWTDAATACGAAAAFGPGWGAAFVFSDHDPFFFLDIDHCRLPDGSWSATAEQLCAVLKGCAVEISQSGTGLHVFGVGQLKPHRKRDHFRPRAGLELYHNKRFVALTGFGAVGTADFVVEQQRLDWLVDSYFVATTGDDDDVDDELSDEPRAGWRGPTDDADLIRRAMQSQSARAAFGDGASFGDLWMADARVLGKIWPPDKPGDEFNHSHADRALAQHLAFWTGCHGQRIERLMRMSALVRSKWDTHGSYMRLTITSAIGVQGDILQDKPPQFEIERQAAEAAGLAPPAPLLPSEAPRARAGSVIELPAAQRVTGATMLGPDSQVELFKTSTYVTDRHMALTHEGELLKPDQFRVRFGGYTFAMDLGNERTSRDAWECFTQSQAYRPPRVDSTCFRPDIAPGVIIRGQGETKINTYRPIEVPRAQGSVEPLLAHLRRLIPDDRDRRILLAYMAAVVQHKGCKFQWCPLIQGVEGNGKSFLTLCVANAVGFKHVHMPRADQISTKFNPWLEGKILIGVEDVFVPNEKQETWEILKPMITADRLPVEPKGVDQRMADVCCNWMLNSNHKDGVKKTRNDRRLAVFFCLQQIEAHLERDGLTPDYFESLFGWYKTGGMEFVNEYLATVPIEEEFNPANGRKAPYTSSREEAIKEGLGFIEQCVTEAIGAGEEGFRNGWVSGTKLDMLIERIGQSRRVPPSKRRGLMQSLGYDWHPGLPEGRANNIVLPDGARSRLYVRIDDAALRGVVGPADIAKAYTTMQAS